MQIMDVITHYLLVQNVTAHCSVNLILIIAVKKNICFVYTQQYLGMIKSVMFVCLCFYTKRFCHSVGNIWVTCSSFMIPALWS